MFKYKQEPVGMYAVMFFAVCILLLGLESLNIGWFTSPVKASQNLKMNYKIEMIQLIEEISQYAKAKNTSFELMGNNGTELYSVEEVDEQRAKQVLNSVDGIIIEGFNYGWEMQDDKRSPIAMQRMIKHNLVLPQQNKMPVLTIDYCTTKKKVDWAYQLSDENQMIGFAANHRQLDVIPTYPKPLHNENTNNIKRLADIKNYLILLNPDKFKTKEQYLTALKQTNYDLLIIDMYFDNQALTPDEVASLKIKANGAVRRVFSYMSIGEAEDYRYYWKAEWSENHPKWIDKENEDWAGNFKVQYWNKDWKKILYGSRNAYLDKILTAGFDGIFMDIVDGFQYFEEK